MKYFDFYKQRIPDFKDPAPGTSDVVVRCVLHPNPDGESLSINLENGKFKCWVPHCAGVRGGGYKKFEALLRGDTVATNAAHAVPGREIPASDIEAHHKVLLQSAGMLELLQKKRGYTMETIKRFKLGYDADRIWIPIADAKGKFFNVRKYKPGASQDKMIGYSAGHNQARLFPAESLKSDWVLLCEGETDTMLACQLGFPAITATGGADTWRDDFGILLKGKKVFVCYDVDQAGKRGMDQVAIKLVRTASEVRKVRLPLRGTREEKDFSNYIVDLGHSADDFAKLLADSELVEDRIAAKAAPEEEAKDIHLSEIGEDRFVGKRVRSTVLVAGKDLAPFQVPFKIAYQCEMGEKICGGCGIARCGGQTEIQIPEHTSTLLEMVNVPSPTLEFVLARLADVPGKCRKFKYDVKEYANLEAIKAIPEIDFASDKSEYVIRSLFFLGSGLETNHTYRVEAVVMPDPKTQYATALIYGAESSQDSIEKFEMTEEMKKALVIFRTGEKS
jgi:hypothetical protein